MRLDFHRTRSAKVAVVLFVLAAACAPAVGVTGDDAPAAPTADHSPANSMTAAPEPDPAAVQTTAPGQHLDVIGTITALAASTVEVDGVTYNLTAATEIKGTLAVGEQVKLEYVTNADGSRTVIEAKGLGFFDGSGSSPAD